MLEQTINQDSDLFKSFMNPEEGEESPIPVITSADAPADIENKQPNGLEITNNPLLNTEEEEEVVVETKTEDESEDTTEDESTEEDSEDEGTYSYKALLSHLSDEGLVDFEDGEDVEDTPELLFNSVKNTITKGIEDYKASIPEKGQKFLDYLEKGGDVDKYFETIQKPFDIKSLDMDSEADQELALREYLKNIDYTSDEIEETITDAKESLILEKQAKIAAKKLEGVFNKREEALIAEQELIRESQAQEYTQYVSTIKNTIENSNELAGLPLTTKEKESFKAYLLAVDKQGLTQYQKEINENPVKTQLELAYLKFMKYDFSKAAKAGATAEVKKLKDIFKKNEKTIQSSKASVESKGSSDDLTAFRSFINSKK